MDDTIHTHQGEDGLVGVVRQEFASLGQSHGVDAMRLEVLDGEIRAYGHYHQRHEESIAASQFGNEEDTRKRGMHDTAHQAAHAQHGEVALWDVDTEDVIRIPYPAEDEAADTTEEKAGGEDTTTTAAAIGGCRGEDLEEDYQGKIDKQMVAAIEEGAVHRSVPISLPVAIEQKGDEVVAFTVKRREEIDEQAQHGRSNQKFLIPSVQATEKPLKEIQLSVNIAKHDLETKANNARKFLEDGSRVRVTLSMKGRELSRREENKKSILEFIVLLEDVAIPEAALRDEGNKTVVTLKKKNNIKTIKE